MFTEMFVKPDEDTVLTFMDGPMAGQKAVSVFKTAYVEVSTFLPYASGEGSDEMINLLDPITWMARNTKTFRYRRDGTNLYLEAG